MPGMNGVEAYQSAYGPREESVHIAGGHATSRFDPGTDPLCLLDTSGAFLDANLAFCEMVGYPTGDLSRMRFGDLEPAAPPLGDTSLAERITRSRRFLTRLRDRNGIMLDVEVGVSVLNAGGKQVLVCHARETGRLERGEDSLARDMFENAPDGYIAIDPVGVIQEINTTILSWLGYSRDEVVGLMELDDLLIAEGTLNLATLAAQADVDRSAGVTELVRKGGGLLPVRISLVRVHDAGGADLGFRVTVRDLSSEKKLEMQLLRAQKLESLGSLVTGVAHDFNNMLTGILGFTQLLLREIPSGGRSYETLKKIEALGERAGQLAGQILAFSRQEGDHKDSVDLHPLLRETTRLLERMIPETIVTELTFGSEDLIVEADPTQLVQVLMNLVVNARDAMPAGGMLGIHADSVNADERFCSQHPELPHGRYARITVTDTGTGIAPDVLPHIFDPFFTTKDAGKGTGLGLPVTRGIVRKYGGSIEIDSALGRGTAIQVFLPVTRVTPDRAAPAPAQVNGGHETILIVEDEPSVLELAQIALETYGYQVLTARDGIGALAVYEAHRSEIALVILDLVMPRMGGLETLKEIRRDDPNVKVLLTTGYESAPEDATGVAAAAASYALLRKPYGIQELARAVRSALRADRVPGDSDS